MHSGGMNKKSVRTLVVYSEWPDMHKAGLRSHWNYVNTIYYSVITFTPKDDEMSSNVDVLVPRM